MLEVINFGLFVGYYLIFAARVFEGVFQSQWLAQSTLTARYLYAYMSHFNRSLHRLPAAPPRRRRAAAKVLAIFINVT